MTTVSQNDLRITDRFEPEVFWREHGNKIVTAVLVVVAIGAGVVFWQRNTRAKAEQAAARLASATDTASLEELIQSNPSEQITMQAMIRLADLQYRDAKYSDAAATYEKFLSKYGTSTMAEAAELGLGAVYEAENKFSEAKTQYQGILTRASVGYTSVAAKLGLARCEEALGNFKEARQLYEEVMASARGTHWEAESYMRWTILGRNISASGVVVPEVQSAGSPPATPQESATLTPAVPQGSQ